MRIAALSDIHGNLPALEAVLLEVEREDVDAIVVSGDSISGPWPVEVFDRLAEVGALIVRGNADRHVLESVAAVGRHLRAQFGTAEDEDLGRLADLAVEVAFDRTGLERLVREPVRRRRARRRQRARLG